MTAIAQKGAFKRGTNGLVSAGPAVQQTYAAAERVVDTTAAGDSFNGGCLAAILSGESQKVARRTGHNLAAKVVGHRGPIIPKSAM